MTIGRLTCIIYQMAISFSEKQIRTVTDLRERTAEVLHEVETKGTPLLIVRRSRPAVVLVNPFSVGATTVDEKVRKRELEEDLKFFREMRKKGKQIDAVATIRKERDSH